MPAPRKYDQETRDRAVRMYQERRRDFPEEALRTSRRRVGELLEVNPETMRGWIEQIEVDTGRRPGVSSDVVVELQTLRREILRTASAFFAAAELDRRLK
jgi:transposase-like protein